ncbi:septum formation family protein [Nocardioides antri]|uniref:Septum formation-related domain-containing protein n=1 Tax=Nocardioides antri TaxID=2607659 RepID=A0A5B1M4A1_9ACTN|nr:septum formation family protein [Nocardioides antri]KAA1427581.1 hypothetical protein F0U47_08985 [Nocardioides antri]
MKLRLGTAVVLAALTSLTSLTAASPARAGVDTSPPAVGSCHDLTKREAWANSEPDPRVPCTARHTTVTVKNIQLAEAPNWRDFEALGRRMFVPCWRSVDAYLDGSVAARVRSAYTIYWFIPTKVQRDAGAKWIRCDLGLPNGDRLKNLPTDGRPALGDLPHPDGIAKCRLGRAASYESVVCSHRHAFRATHHVRHAADRYPGARTMRRWTIRKCRARLNTAFYYEYPQNRLAWRAGHRFAVCLKETRA